MDAELLVERNDVEHQPESCCHDDRVGFGRHLFHTEHNVGQRLAVGLLVDRCWHEFSFRGDDSRTDLVVGVVGGRARSGSVESVEVAVQPPHIADRDYAGRGDLGADRVVDALT